MSTLTAETSLEPSPDFPFDIETVSQDYPSEYPHPARSENVIVRIIQSHPLLEHPGYGLLDKKFAFLVRNTIRYFQCLGDGREFAQEIAVSETTNEVFSLGWPAMDKRELHFPLALSVVKTVLKFASDGVEDGTITWDQRSTIHEFAARLYSEFTSHIKLEAIEEAGNLLTYLEMSELFRKTFPDSQAPIRVEELLSVMIKSGHGKALVALAGKEIPELDAETYDRDD